jgi:hypothetical protein
MRARQVMDGVSLLNSTNENFMSCRAFLKSYGRSLPALSFPPLDADIGGTLSQRCAGGGLP